MSNPLIDGPTVFLKALLDRGFITAQEYNDHIFSAVKLGYLKDVTPHGLKITDPQKKVHAIVEFPSGDRYEIEIYLLKEDREKNILNMVVRLRKLICNSR